MADLKDRFSKLFLQVLHLKRLKMDDTENPPKFTVQQIILLQKLVQSGLTKDQIIAGVEEMEKLGCGSGGAARSDQSAAVNGQNSSGREQEKTGAEISRCQSPYQVPGNANFPAHLQQQGNSLVYQQSLRNSTHHLPSLLPQVGAAWSTPTQAVAATLLQNGFGNNPQSAAYTNLIASRGFLRRGSDGGPACLPNSGPNGMPIDRDNDQQQQQQQQQHQLQADINEELEELFRQDPAVVKEEIRKFISERHISQSAIAKATRNAISQSYISQWLAQPQDISGQKKRTMYTWYITEKRKYAAGLGGPLSGVQQQLLFRGSSNDNDVEHSSLLKSKRGSRFTWPKECVTVLEGFYISNNYPDESKREEIAQACNVIIQSHKPGLVMSETEKVTAGKVYNWFANRRKDDKRRRTIEQADALDQNLTTPSPQLRICNSPTYSVHSNESGTQGNNGTGGGGGEQSGVQNSTKTPTASSNPFPQSFAYEMAQVNNSILALVNPHNDNNVGGGDADECERRLAGKLSDLHQAAAAAAASGKDLSGNNVVASSASLPTNIIKHEVTEVSMPRVYGNWRPNTTSSAAVSADNFSSSPHQQISSSS